MNSISQQLKEASKQLAFNSDSADLEAEILLCLILNKSRTFLRTWPEQILKTQQLTQFQDLVQQRIQGIPIAYLTGYREFWSRDFLVNEAVLIPRADTELLIELSLELIQQQSLALLDLGTGSGVIGITLAAECPAIEVMATDFSQSALRVAEQNASRLAVANIEFKHSDWFTNLPPKSYQIIISNPPYIAEDDPHLQQGDLRFEPFSALAAPQSGLADIHQIIKQSWDFLSDNGYLLIEHGYQQQPAVQALFKAQGYQQITIHSDLGGQPRVTIGRKVK